MPPVFQEVSFKGGITRGHQGQLVKIMLSDPFADLLIRMKNARLSKHRELTVPYSKRKEALVKLLAERGYLESYKVKGRELIITKPYLVEARRLSKPGSRLYAGVAELSRYLRGRRETILSTSSGLLTAREAFKRKLGGELIAYVEK